MGSIMTGVDSTCRVPVDFAERENNPLNEAVQMSAVPRAIPAGSRSDSSPIFFYLRLNSTTCLICVDVNIH